MQSEARFGSEMKVFDFEVSTCSELPEWAVAVYTGKPRRLVAMMDVRDDAAVTRDAAADELLARLLNTGQEATKP